MFQFKNVDYLPEDKIILPDKLWPFMWYFIRQSKWIFLLILALITTASSLWALWPFFLGKIFDVLAAFESNPKQAFDDLALIVSIAIGCCFIIQPLIVHSAIYIEARTMSVFVGMMRRQLCLYCYGHSYEFFQSDFSGRIAGKVVETPSRIRETIHIFVHTFLWGFTAIFTAIFMLFLASKLLFVVGVVWLGLYLLLMFFITPKIRDLSEQGAIRRGYMRGAIVDTLGNILTTKLFSNQDKEDREFTHHVRETADFFEKSDLQVFKLWVLLELLTFVLWFIVIVYSLYSWSEGGLAIGAIAMVMGAIYDLTERSWNLSTQFSAFFQKIGEIEEGMEAIVKPYNLVDTDNAEDFTLSTPTIDIDIKNFSYNDEAVFKDFALSIPAQQKLGIVGRSGAGKSTLVQLMLRLYNIQSGKVLIDGHDIAKVTQTSLRRNIAVIPQDTSLFHRTLMENIRYGRLSASDDEVIAAARKAYAHDFISELPDGYNTLVGERGVKLSGGQRQRIAIARAVLKDAPILILDEATSALDSESERLIQESLKDLMKGKTVIAIAHRLSTIAHLDRLIVLDHGKIIEDGTHDALLQQDGHYAKLWEMQSGGFLGE
ncbi:MAG: ABC transporter ATP-binding protein [Pseudomonadota bacterium]